MAQVNRTPNHTCQQCGKGFYRSPAAGRAVFCSMACKVASRRPHPEIVLPDGSIGVPLPSGLYTLVSAEDAPFVRGIAWHTIKGDDRLYVNSSSHGLLHRILLDAPDHLFVDHINGDTLDNRRSNLRLATPSQNAQNTAQHADSAAPYKGIYLHRESGMWAACLMVKGAKHSGGYFSSPEDAARAYDALAKEHHGRFARLNFPEE